MTIHLAKGLNSHVLWCGMEEDLFPSAMSMSTRSELEEERRLFYVLVVPSGVFDVCNHAIVGEID
jgi:superfamily I DNA/RNA helicase